MMKLIEGAPIFAVEVRSEGDYGADAEKLMARKRGAYFAAGTQVVWDVDLLGEEVVRVYRLLPGEAPFPDEEAPGVGPLVRERPPLLTPYRRLPPSPRRL